MAEVEQNKFQLGSIYVIDASEQCRIDAALKHFEIFLKLDPVKEKPVLVLVTKTDHYKLRGLQFDCLNADIKRLVAANHCCRPVLLKATCSTAWRLNRKLKKNAFQGVHWLIGATDDNIDTIRQQVKT